VITKLLVANRGEIAERVVRSARAFGIATVAVFSDADADARFVQLADEAVRLPGNTPTETYLDIAAVLDAAARTGADAVHPGYGFLSERADFARACGSAGVVFVGPSPEAIEVMGSKLRSKALVGDAGVPVLPSVTMNEDDDAVAGGVRIGYPLLVKASAGGGGRGMRIVRDESDLAEAVESARREAVAAFGDGTVFLERLVERARHIEVQVFGDSHGNVVHFFERECSIQRRHQKIIEESPSPAVDDALRARITDAAVTCARAVDYENAGTVEFLLAPDGTFFFLEMNTRLQVEHPVTEMVTGVDLVELQLRVAQGEPLPREAMDARIRGHAIEARLYAEDVAAGYLPTSGTLDRFRIPTSAAVRVDAGYGDGAVVSTFYDAMLAKVIGFDETRADAAHRLAEALATAEVHGLTTNRDLLVGILRHPAFLAGDTDIEFLEHHDAIKLAASSINPEATRTHAIAAVLAAQTARRAASTVLPHVPPAWRNVGPAAQPHEFIGPDGIQTTVEVTARRDGVTARVDEVAASVVVHRAAADMVDVEVDGHRVSCGVHHAGGYVYVDSPLGSTRFHEIPRFEPPAREDVTGSLLSPMPGAVIAIEVEAGARVTAGTVLVTLEAMKMEHVIRAPHDGVVAEVRVASGDQVETGTVLVVMAKDDDELAAPVTPEGAR
jgi:acetyl/propionyl-CoA carboxylase alpha subunit